MKKIDDTIIKELLSSVDDPTKLFDKGGLMQELTKRLVETLLEEEMTEHLGYKKHETTGNNSGNSRNGHSSKTITTNNGDMNIDIPRDRNSEFQPS
jgi:transposase-like protein